MSRLRYVILYYENACMLTQKEVTALLGLQIRVRIGKLFFLFLIQSICCGYSKEPSRRDGSFKHPAHTYKLMYKKIITFYANLFLNWSYVTKTHLSYYINFGPTFLQRNLLNISILYCCSFSSDQCNRNEHSFQAVERLHYYQRQFSCHQI